jgi:MaoC like domain
MVWPFAKVLRSSKPLLAPAELQPPLLQATATDVRLRAAHLTRYRDICGLSDSGVLPPAYLHVLSMPLHLRIFTHALFPVQVLGLIHLRNVIRQLQPVSPDSRVELSVSYQTLRQTTAGQEYDIVTHCNVAGQRVWEEVSTMLARRATPGKRPSIERARRDATLVVNEQIIATTANIGRRYAFVSGDFNPIHLFDRTAQAFQFKQAVAHGMWSLARCIGLADASFTSTAVQYDAQFKLPIYLPSEFVFRQQRAAHGAELSLSTPKGDRLHLAVQATAL